MAEGPAAALRAQLAAIDARLAQLATPEERAAAKSEIFGLHKAVEQQLAELAALKEDVRKLVEKWKTANGAAASQAPQFSAEKPVVHADHLGASTFIEKGWSKLSLGDHEGAEVALKRALELSPNDPQTEALLGWAQMLQEKYDDALLNFQKVLMRQPANAGASDGCSPRRLFHRSMS